MEGGKSRWICCVLFACLIAVTIRESLAQPPTYSIVDLGVVDNRVLNPTQINNSGQVIGFTKYPINETTVPTKAWLWEAGTATPLGDLGGDNTEPLGINDAGQIVGSARLADGSYHAFLWDDGVMTDLGPGTATGINSLGQIVGYTAYPWRPCTWQSGSMELLDISGFETGKAEKINDSGLIVGTGDPIGWPKRALLWDARGMVDLGDLGGASSEGISLNNDGLVLLDAQLGTNEWHAACYDNGVISDLGTLGGLWSYSEDINAFGDIVGRADSDTSRDRACLWTDGAAWDLSELIPQDSEYAFGFAYDINDEGWIVAYGIRDHAFQASALLIPTPEPGIIGLLIAGFLCVRKPRQKPV